jgi:hypothetical protein
MSFKDWLEKQAQEAVPAEAAATLPAPPEADAEPDPFEGLVGKGEGGLGERSPFDAFLDSVEAERPADFVPTIKASEHHDWQIVRAAVYSQDHVVWLCAKCCRTVSVERDETLGQALEKISVREDCSLQVASEVMET